MDMGRHYICEAEADLNFVIVIKSTPRDVLGTDRYDLCM